MTRFLFWNMGGKSLTEPLFRLAHRKGIDVLLLAETEFSPGQALEVLNREQALYYFPETQVPDREKVHIFTRFGGELLQYETHHSKYRWTMRRLLLPGIDEILVVAVHLNSKAVFNKWSQASECRDLAEHILSIEERLRHRRTLVIGDFNVNPFEAGMVGFKSLNAKPTRLKAKATIKVEDGREFPKFYNPMWNFFGDETRGPAGTYHYSPSHPVALEWNMFDQVLLRPSLLPFFSIADLEIPIEDGEQPFLTAKAGVPGARGGSDHLPIMFSLNL